MPSWMLLLFDPESGLDVDPRLLRLDLAITPREADVAALLAKGFSLRAAAAKLGISAHTREIDLYPHGAREPGRSRQKSAHRSSGVRAAGREQLLLSPAFFATTQFLSPEGPGALPNKLVKIA